MEFHGLVSNYLLCSMRAVLLLLWPNLALMIANYALAAVLCIVGIVMVTGYIRGEAMEGIMGLQAGKGPDFSAGRHSVAI